MVAGEPKEPQLKDMYWRPFLLSTVRLRGDRRVLSGARLRRSQWSKNWLVLTR